MPIIDSQVHCYERNNPNRPWAGVLHGPPEVTGDDMVKAMDAVGVDGALLVSPFAMYRYDASYAIEVYEKHPHRFGLIKPVDPTDPSVDDIISDWKKTKGTVGVRIMMNRPDVATDATDPGLNRVLTAGAKANFPVNILAWGRLDQLKKMAALNPDTSIVLDHIGLQQPFDPPPPKDGWVDVGKVIELAALKNVSIKISGACTLSQGAPFDDIWDPLQRIFDAFGLERCLWGTDWTRATGLLTYEQGVDPFRNTTRLSASDKAMLMGGALERIYKWAPRR